MPYFQPRLSSDLPRAYHMFLGYLAHRREVAPAGLAAERVSAFLREYFELCEGPAAQDDRELTALLAACGDGQIELVGVEDFGRLPREAGDDRPLSHPVITQANTTRSRRSRPRFVLPPPSASERAHELARLEFDRCLAAFDGPDPVGTATAFSFETTVPGGQLATAGVSWVSALATHRRRGIIDASSPPAARLACGGAPVAALLPTETPLYGRYGYGMATRQAAFTIRRGEGGLARDAPADPAIRLRIVAPHQARDAIAAVYDEVRRVQPGFLARPRIWWDRVLRDPGGRYTPLSCLLAADEAGPRGLRPAAGLCPVQRGQPLAGRGRPGRRHADHPRAGRRRPGGRRGPVG